MDTDVMIEMGWRAAQAAFRAVQAMRSVRDAESLIHQLEAMGAARRADLSEIEAERLRQIGAAGSD